MGYMYMIDETQATIDEEGYLHSGDVADFDNNNQSNVVAPSGFMKITGRIKELIITAGGENIPPVLIENVMKSLLLAVSNVIVIGDRKKYLICLVSLKCETDLETGLPTNQLAADALHVAKTILHTPEITTYSAAKEDPRWITYIEQGIKQTNQQSTSNAQIIQKFRWLPEDFSEKAGDLTPTLKLKRKVVTEKYLPLIESMYAEDEK
jgi:long-chain-fatty-acid--CoA ligase ACSBG